METGQKDIICPLPGGMRRKRAAELFGAGVGAARNRVKAYRGGGMAALRPGNGNAGQAVRPAVRRDRDAGDTEAPRRRVEEPEPGDAVMREVVEVAGKDPGAGLRVRAAGAFAASEGGYGYRRVKAMLRTRVSEKVLRSPMP